MSYVKMEADTTQSGEHMEPLDLSGFSQQFITPDISGIEP